MSSTTSPKLGRNGMAEQRPGPGRGEVGAEVGNLDEKIQALHVAFRDALLAIGGDYPWLAAAIGESAVSYQHDIAKGVARRDGRELQMRWLVPLLEDSRSAEEFIGYLCEVAGFAPPVPKHQVTREQLEQAEGEVVENDEDLAGFRQVIRERAARRRGWRIQDLP